MIRRYTKDDGAAALEFALVAPIFIALVFGIISYGWMLSFRQSLSQAASEGARILAVTPAGAPDMRTDAITAINRALGSYNVTCSGSGALQRNGATVGSCSVPSDTTACLNDTSLKCATVSINYSYRANPLVPSFPGLGIVLPQNLHFETTVVANS